MPSFQQQSIFLVLITLLTTLLQALPESENIVEITVINNFNHTTVDPEVLLLDKIDPREQPIPEGSYELRVQHPGFQEYRATLDVRYHQSNIFSKKIVLIAKQRRVHFKLARYTPDLINDMGKILVRDSIKGKLLHRLSQAKSCALTPGKYLLEVFVSGYNNFQEEITVFPSDDPFLLEIKLQPKPIPFTFDIIYFDYKGDPWQEEELLSLPVATFYSTQKDIHIDETKKIIQTPQRVTLNLKGSKKATITPGNYRLQLKTSGFPTVNKDITLPVAKKYRYQEKLTSHEYVPIYFHGFNGHFHDSVLDVESNGERLLLVRWWYAARTGTQQFKVIFQRSKTVFITKDIKPADQLDIEIFAMPLKRLSIHCKRVERFLSKESMTAIVDGSKVEEHHFNCRGSSWWIQVPRNSKRIQLFYDIYFTDEFEITKEYHSHSKNTKVVNYSNVDGRILAQTIEKQNPEDLSNFLSKVREVITNKKVHNLEHLYFLLSKTSSRRKIIEKFLKEIKE